MNFKFTSLFVCTVILSLSWTLTGCGGGAGGAGVLSGNTTLGAGRTDTSAVTTTNVCTDPSTPHYATATDPSTQRANTLYRWIAFPVRVYFQNDAERTPERLTETLAGFNWWVQRTDGRVRYVVTDRPNEANITVVFAHQGQNDHGAVTEYHVTSRGVLTDAKITFNLTYLTQLRHFRPIAAHEMGHALGIAGHSPHPDDVMFPGSATYDRTDLSERDSNTLQLAYCPSRASRAETGIRDSEKQVFRCFTK